MERQQVLLVDAFADRPTGGRQVAVLPNNSATASQRAAVGSELQTSGVVTYDDGELEYTDCDGSQAVISGAVAGYAALSNRGLIVPSEHDFHVAGESVDAADPFPVELTEDGHVTVSLPATTVRELDTESADLADALGVDRATLQDVGADLPAARTDTFGGTVLVPINFLQHLSAASPDYRAIVDILGAEDASRLVAYTFDTLESHTDVHARVFDPTAPRNERPASGVAGAACAAHVGSYEAFDGERAEIAIESGRFAGRPSTMRATVSTDAQVTGGALTVLDASLAVPADEGTDDDIIEV